VKHHIRLWATLAVCVAAFAPLLLAFRLLNRPSDLSVVAGIVVLLALLLIVPLAVRTVWRKV
jgi:hypothetical protein